MDEVTIRRARLIELKDDLTDIKSGGKSVPVQFNPESLKLSYANQAKNDSNGSSKEESGEAKVGNQSQPARQFVGQGTTKLSLQLWFDVTAATNSDFMQDDVRNLTARVLYFMQPRAPEQGANDASQKVPPGVRFEWNQFQFDGIIESIEENIEFFSPEGKALRASMSLSLVQQNILVKPAESQANHTNKIPGTLPLRSAKSGQTVPQLAGDTDGGSTGNTTGSSRADGTPSTQSAGIGAALASSAGVFGEGRSWQKVAVTNGIENPRAVRPGQLIDLFAKRARIITE